MRSRWRGGRGTEDGALQENGSCSPKAAAQLRLCRNCCHVEMRAQRSLHSAFLAGNLNSSDLGKSNKTHEHDAVRELPLCNFWCIDEKSCQSSRNNTFLKHRLISESNLTFCFWQLEVATGLLPWVSPLEMPKERLLPTFCTTVHFPPAT